MAELNGVNTTRLNMLSFGLGCALAAAAGVILAPVFPVTPTAGVPVALTAFVVVVLGGMGSLWGCVVGGLTLGLVENLGAAFISTGYKNVFGFIILILVLLVRPAGIFPGCRKMSGICIINSCAPIGRVWSPMPQMPFWPSTSVQTFAGDIEGRSMIDRGTDKGQTHGDIYGIFKVEQL